MPRYLHALGDLRKSRWLAAHATARRAAPLPLVYRRRVTFFDLDLIYVNAAML